MIRGLTKEEAWKLAMDYFTRYNKRVDENLATMNIEVHEEIISDLGNVPESSPVMGASGNEVFIGEWFVTGDAGFDETAGISIMGNISFKEIQEGKMPLIVDTPTVHAPDTYTGRAFLRFYGYIFRNNL